MAGFCIFHTTTVHNKNDEITTPGCRREGSEGESGAVAPGWFPTTAHAAAAGRLPGGGFLKGAQAPDVYETPQGGGTPPGFPFQPAA